MNEQNERWDIVATAVNERMKALGMHRQVNLVSASGLSDPTVRVFMTGKLRDDRPPDSATRAKICDALGWTTESIDLLLQGKPAIVADVTPSRLDEKLDRQQEQLEGLAGQTTELLRLVVAQGAAIDQILVALRRGGRGS